MDVRRSSILGLMSVVVVAALVMAVVRERSWIVSAAAVELTVYAAMALAVVGALCRRGPQRAWWVGFAVFGGGFLHFLPGLTVWRRYNGASLVARGIVTCFVAAEEIAASRVVNGLSALAAAALGGLLARRLFGDTGAPLPAPDPLASRAWWRGPWVAGSAGLGLTALAFLVRPGRSSAAVALGATLGWFGLAAVGAAFARGKHRAAWLGTALFGGVTLALLSTGDGVTPIWARTTADRYLIALRPWVVRPRGPDDPAAVTNSEVLQALDRVVPMHFPDPTPLKDFLDAVRSATRSRGGRDFPVYVDPASLQESEKTLQEPIAIDLGGGVPLRMSLNLALKQLGLRYNIRGGALIIDSEMSNDDPPGSAFGNDEDPYLASGRCLLACLAGCLGGLLAPRVADP